ncbi:MAG: squalene/phytoene synthase family protein, partial [Myxococcota bacterium]|nr:squalene/phytoene synthase family protein [Myxococcota bacterium]
VPASAPLRQLVAFEAARARDLLSRGEPLLSALAGSARLAVAGFAAGGHAALDAIERADCDVTSELRRPTRRGVLFHAVRLWLRAGRSGAGR